MWTARIKQGPFAGAQDKTRFALFDFCAAVALKHKAQKRIGSLPDQFASPARLIGRDLETADLEVLKHR